MTRRINERGLSIIKRFEGVSLKPYICPAGVPTIGYGRTKGVTMKMPPITPKQADQYLKEDVAEAEEAVNLLVTVPLNDNQFSALVSFVFNMGQGAFQRSTLLRKLNAGDAVGAAAQLERWVFAKGKELPGLKTRRAVERALFLSTEGIA